jgi:hypothetical protein
LAAVKIKKKENIDLGLLKTYIGQNKIKRLNGRVRRYLCITLLSREGVALHEIEKWINQAIKMDRENGLAYELGMDYMVFSELLRKTGDVAKAKEILGLARSIFKECGADGWVERVEKDLSLN